MTDAIPEFDPIWGAGPEPATPGHPVPDTAMPDTAMPEQTASPAESLPADAPVPLEEFVPAAEPGESGPLLTATGLSVGFPIASSLVARMRHEARVLRAVDGVDLTIERGEALALVGESGSGKSTLARALTGLVPLDGGEIRLGDRVLSGRRSRADQRRIQMVFQDPYSSLNPRLTVAGVLHELLRVHDIVPRAEVDSFSRELIGLVGLTDDALHAYPRQFSGGQRQRVAIARALALRPDLLVADEPVSALDVSVQATILNLLQELRRSLGLTLMLISHNLAVVRHLCDRTAVMYLGRIIEVAPTEELFAAPAHPYTQGLLAAIPRMTARTDDEAPAVVGDPPSPLRIPAGCRFRTRCPIARERCSREDPALTTAPGHPGHQAACHFAFDSVPPAAGAVSIGMPASGTSGHVEEQSSPSP
jgi:oligopeptide/dipeptide ABC transporter ATP-binding protein